LVPNGAAGRRVLRSWEDRFGARLLQVGFAEIRLLAGRPARTIEAAQHVAAEHYAFRDECGTNDLCDVAGITASPLDSPIWTSIQPAGRGR
jgi:hypothetical protein